MPSKESKSRTNLSLLNQMNGFLTEQSTFNACLSVLRKISLILERIIADEFEDLDEALRLICQIAARACLSSRDDNWTNEDQVTVRELSSTVLYRCRELYKTVSHLHNIMVVSRLIALIYPDDKIEEILTDEPILYSLDFTKFRLKIQQENQKNINYVLPENMSYFELQELFYKVYFGIRDGKRDSDLLLSIYNISISTYEAIENNISKDTIYAIDHDVILTLKLCVFAQQLYIMHGEFSSRSRSKAIRKNINCLNKLIKYADKTPDRDLTLKNFLVFTHKQNNLFLNSKALEAACIVIPDDEEQADKIQKVIVPNDQVVQKDKQELALQFESAFLNEVTDTIFTIINRYMPLQQFESIDQLEYYLIPRNRFSRFEYDTVGFDYASLIANEQDSFRLCYALKLYTVQKHTSLEMNPFRQIWIEFVLSAYDFIFKLDKLMPLTRENLDALHFYDYSNYFIRGFVGYYTITPQELVWTCDSSLSALGGDNNKPSDETEVKFNERIERIIFQAKTKRVIRNTHQEVIARQEQKNDDVLNASVAIIKRLKQQASLTPYWFAQKGHIKIHFQIGKDFDLAIAKLEEAITTLHRHLENALEEEKKISIKASIYDVYLLVSNFDEEYKKKVLIDDEVVCQRERKKLVIIEGCKQMDQLTSEQRCDLWYLQIKMREFLFEKNTEYSSEKSINDLWQLIKDEIDKINLQQPSLSGDGVRRTSFEYLLSELTRDQVLLDSAYVDNKILLLDHLFECVLTVRHLDSAWYYYRELVSKLHDNDSRSFSILQKIAGFFKLLPDHHARYLDVLNYTFSKEICLYTRTRQVIHYNQAEKILGILAKVNPSKASIDSRQQELISRRESVHILSQQARYSEHRENLTMNLLLPVANSANDPTVSAEKRTELSAAVHLYTKIRIISKFIEIISCNSAVKHIPLDREQQTNVKKLCDDMAVSAKKNMEGLFLLSSTDAFFKLYKQLVLKLHSYMSKNDDDDISLNDRDAQIKWSNMMCTMQILDSKFDPYLNSVNDDLEKKASLCLEKQNYSRALIHYARLEACTQRITQEEVVAIIIRLLHWHMYVMSQHDFMQAVVLVNGKHIIKQLIDKILISINTQSNSISEKWALNLEGFTKYIMKILGEDESIQDTNGEMIAPQK